jgi:hypothetical protein
MEKVIYRVMLTGELVDGFDRPAVADGLARLFGIPADQAARTLEAGGYPIEGFFDADEVIDLQTRLERLGAHARAERVADDPDLGSAIGPTLRLPSVRRAPAADSVPRPPAPAVEPAPSRRAPMRPRAGHARNGGADIHALETRRLHEGWLDDDKPEPTEDDRIELFMGTGAAHLYEPCRRMKMGWRTRARLTWAGGAVFSPFLWAMYRKMWAWGLVIFVGEILLPVILITWGTQDGASEKFTWLGVALLVANRIFWPLTLKWLYCRHARKTVLRLNRMAPTFAPDIDIAAKGGTSRTSVFVGIVLAIVVSMLTWTAVDGVYAWSALQGPALAIPDGTGPAPQSQPSRPQPVPGVSENKWVQTRSGLRDVGRRLQTWFGAAGRDRAPRGMTIDDVVRVLKLEPAQWLDAWGQPMTYVGKDRGFRLISAGPDGEFGTADDIAHERSLDR